ncbi:SprB repeat-containing protein, partial [Flexibacter flexilis DSM 6793]
MKKIFTLFLPIVFFGLLSLWGNTAQAQTATVTNVSCYNACDGSITITDIPNFTGNYNDYIFYWEDLGFSADTGLYHRENLCAAANYNIFIVLVNDIFTSYSLSVEITENPQITLTSTVTSSVCSNAEPFQIKTSTNADALPGTFTWTYLDASNNLQTLVKSNTNVGIDYVNPSQLAVGNVLFTCVFVDIKGCSDTTTFNVNIKPSSPVDFTYSPTSVCINEYTTVAASVAFSPFFTYKWELAGLGEFLGGGTTKFGYGPHKVRWFSSNAGNGIVLTVSNPSVCGGKATKNITVFNNPTASITGLSSSYCNNISAATITGGSTSGTFKLDEAVVGTSTTNYILNPSALSLGSHTIKFIAINAAGCKDSISQSFNVLETPVASISGINSSYCINDPAVTAVGSGTPAGGTGTFLTQTGLTAGGVFTPSVAGVGIYTIQYVYTSANGCKDTANFDVTVTPIPDVAASPSPASVCSGSTTNIALTSTTPSATFAWTASLLSGTVTGFADGSGSTIAQALSGVGVVRYTVNSSANGCTGSAIFVDITVKPLPTATLSGVGTICSGASSSISIALTGSAPWVLVYNDGTGNVTVNNILTSPHTISVSPSATTTYSLVSVSDANCTGTVSGSATVTVNPLPNVIATPPSDAICSGTSTNIALTSGVAGATFSWTASGISGSVSGFSAGSGSTIAQTLTGIGVVRYTITATANGCSGSTITVDVTVKQAPTASLSGTGNICAGGSASLSVVLTGTAPWSLVYNDGTGNVTVNNILVSPHTISVSPSTTTTYNLVSVSDANCTGTVSGSATVTVKPLPVITATPSSETLCSGGATNIALTSTVPTTTMSWTASLVSGTVSGFSAGSGSTIAQILTGSGVVRYTINSSANGCSGNTITVDVTVKPLPTASLSGTGNICSGGSANLSVVLTGSAPWILVYNDGTSNITVNNILVSPHTISVSPSTTTTYNLVSVSDANCTGTVSGSATVTVKPLPTASLSGTGNFCSGGSANLSVVFTGSAPWSLVYNDGTGNVTVNNILTSPHTISVSPSTTTTYSLVSVSDANCTGTVSGSATVTVKPLPTASLSGTGNFCSGGSANLSVVLTGSAPWSLVYNDGTSNITVNNILVSPHTISVSPSTTTTYNLVSVSDANCTGTVSGSATVTVKPLPTASLSGTGNFCSGGSANLSVVLTGSAPWNLVYNDGTGNVTVNNILTSPHTISVSPSSTTTYSLVSVSDANCTGTVSGSATVTVKPLPTASLSGTGNFCSGGSASLSVVLTGSAPWNLVYNDGTGNVTVNNILTSPHTISVSPSATTTYSLVSVSDANCTGTVSGSATVTVTPIPDVTATPTAEMICSTASTNISLSSSSGAAVFNWTASLVSGTVTGFSAGSGSSIAQALTGTGVVRYTITSSANGCSSTPLTVDVTVTSIITASVSLSRTPSGSICIGNNVVITATPTNGGATPTYDWFVNGSSTPVQSGTSNVLNVTGLTANTTVDVVMTPSGIGCLASPTATASISIPVVPGLLVSSVVTPASACGASDGSIVVTITNGTTPSFSWSDGSTVVATTKDLVNFPAGTYILTVTDASCSASYTATITAPLPAGTTVTPVVTRTSSCGSADGAIALTVSGFSTAPTFAWYALPARTFIANTQNLAALAAGQYRVVVAVNNSCMDSITVTVTSPIAGLVATSTPTTVCGSTDGSASVTATGLSAATTYLWQKISAPINNNVSTAASTGNILAAGNYRVIVTDGFCTDTAFTTVFSPAPFAVAVSSTNESACNAADGSITLTVTGATGSLTYVWKKNGIVQSALTSSSATNLSAGIYRIIIAQGFCVDSVQRIITSPAPFSLAATVTDVTLCGASDGSITLTTTGTFTAPLTYTWTSLGGYVGSNSPSQTNLPVDVYTILVQDGAGCSAVITRAVNSPAPYTLSSSVVNPSVCSGADGSINLSISPSGTYDYTWFDNIGNL